MTKRIFIQGDRVAAVNDNLKGVVVQATGNKVTIICEDGFEQEFDPSELIKLAKWDELIGEPSSEKIRSAAGHRTKKRESVSSRVREVDLHLHELTDSERGMSNHEKLQLQLEVARRELDRAMDRKSKKIVFIHGRGQGVLRSALHEMLRGLPVDFHDASYLEYGQGATEVILYQNRK